VVAFFLLASSTFAGEHQPLQFSLALLSISEPGIMLPQVRGLNDGLEEAGYVSGKNIAIHHLRNGSVDEIRQRLNSLVQQGVDVIVATSAFETAIARQVTNKIPIVFAPSLDPVRMGFVKSRSRPGANLTGLSFTRGAEDNAKQLEVFKQIVPTMRRTIMFYDGRPSYQPPIEVRASIKRTAQRLGVQLTESPVAFSADAVGVLEQMPKGATDGVFLICTALFRELKPLADAAAHKGVPLFGCTTSQVADEGATMTYTPDIYLLGYRGAWYVDRILKGAKPEQLPVETPSKLELLINLKNARSIGLKIPPERLILADRVFQ
jgi:putative ABC transport system substrate-binding protein